MVWKRQIYSTLTKVYMVMRWSDIHPNGDKLLVGVGVSKVSKEMRKWVGVSHWWPLRVRMGWRMEDVWVLAYWLCGRRHTHIHAGSRQASSINTAAAIVTK